MGLTYLTLDRLSRTLSGGEVERIHLATSLGSSLVDTLYVLDEPSIGLHERDNELLIRLLKELRDLGNTVVVVEHDRTMIEAADEVIDLGPLGGKKGGEILFQGKVEGLAREDRSLTGKYLAGRLEIGWGDRRVGRRPRDQAQLKMGVPPAPPILPTSADSCSHAVEGSGGGPPPVGSGRLRQKGRRLFQREGFFRVA